MLALPRVKEKVIAIVAKRQSTNGAEQRKSSETTPICTHRSAFKPAQDITSGMPGESREKVDRCWKMLPGRETVDPDCVPVLYQGATEDIAESSSF
jgi:hypothetical protein